MAKKKSREVDSTNTTAHEAQSLIRMESDNHCGNDSHKTGGMVGNNKNDNPGAEGECDVVLVDLQMRPSDADASQSKTDELLLVKVDDALHHNHVHEEKPLPLSVRTSSSLPLETNITKIADVGEDANSLGVSSHGTNQVKSSLLSRKILAVETRNVCFKYRSSPNLILNNVSIKIPEGTIYGLLGPSGCGKTSLLRCILNQLTPASGNVSIFGSRPGDKGSLIPGPGVGYMPQDIALVVEFTILETIYFFGRLHGMKKEQLQERANFLLKFLDLPDGNRLIRDLSGGQRRRVSLAAALVHSPPLLVLDEPTVGVDPLLRETIWEHLVSLAEEEHMTVIITTHYIEEARRAHTVGFLRRGKLLVQDNPDNILSLYGLDSLELAFLKICAQEQEANDDGEEDILSQTDISEKIDKGRKTSSHNMSNTARANMNNIHHQNSQEESNMCDQSTGKKNTADASGPPGSVIMLNHLNSSKEDEWQEVLSDSLPKLHQFNHKSHGTYKQTFWFHVNIVQTLVSKGVLKMKRSIPELLFNIVNPAIQVILFCLAVGQIPKGLRVAIFNADQPSLTDTNINYSEMFLQHVNNESISLRYCDSLEEAMHAVKTSDAWAAVEFPQNYSFYLGQRMTSMFGLDNETLEGSAIRIHADMTEYPIQIQLGQELMKAMGAFIKDLLHGSSFLQTFMPFTDVSRLLTPPVIISDPPVYGHFSPDYREFTTPGFILGIIYVVAVGLTAVSLVQERKDGILERSLVAGVRAIHILCAHILVQFCLIFFQGLFLFLVMFELFNISINGSTILAFLLLLFQGAAGMSLGFMVSSVCHEERPATMLSLALFYPNLILSGLVWPIEGMPYLLRQISYCLPQTLAITSMRSIISRGLGLGSSQVYLGFIASIAWIVAYDMIALICFASDRRP